MMNFYSEISEQTSEISELWIKQKLPKYVEPGDSLKFKKKGFTDTI